MKHYAIIQKSLIFSLFIMSLFSCVSANLTADQSYVKESPLAPIKQAFKLDSVNITFSSTYQHYQQKQFEDSCGVTSADLKQYLYTQHPEFFKDSELSFPINVNISVSMDHEMHGGFFVMYICTLGILPAKGSGQFNSTISISPASENLAQMFSLKTEHHIKQVTYVTAFSPIGWFMGDSPKEDNERLSHRFPQIPKEVYSELYNKFVAKRIMQELSSLKLTQKSMSI